LVLKCGFALPVGKPIMVLGRKMSRETSKKESKTWAEKGPLDRTLGSTGGTFRVSRKSKGQTHVVSTRRKTVSAEGRIARSAKDHSRRSRYRNRDR
jgi:hypothetical protein